MTAPPDDTTTDLHAVIAALRAERDAAVVREAQRDSDYAERAAHQGATVEVLQAMAVSPGDPKPVFEVIVRRARDLCDGYGVSLAQVVDSSIVLQAYIVADEALGKRHEAGFPRPVAADTIFGRAILAREPVQIPDVAADETFALRESTLRGAVRALVAVPLMRDGEAIGAIDIARRQTGEFSPAQIELLQVLANQAVIAINSAEMYRALQTRTRDLQESLEYQTATSDVMKVISRSTFDLQPVLNTLVETAARLCDAEQAVINRREGDAWRFEANFGFPPEFEAYVRSHGPMSYGPDAPSVAARAARERRPVHIRDVAAVPGYPDVSITLGRQRTSLGVPLMREGEVIGTIVLARQRVAPFTERQIDLVSTFADQAVIAIENTRLLTEQQEALEQQTATAEVLQVINASPGNLQPVFDTMLEKAHRLCGAIIGSLLVYDGEYFHAAATHGLPQQMALFVRQPFPPNRFLNELLRGEGILHIPHPRGAEADQDHELTRSIIEKAGVRTSLWVPLRKDGTLLGCITAFRMEVQPFSEREITLLESFAAQAVIAMENARLITEQREALEQQTATAEVLQVINASPGNLAPVFDAMLAKAMHLCEAAFGLLLVSDGRSANIVGSLNVPPAFTDYLAREPPRLDEHTFLAHALREQTVIRIADAAEGQPYRTRTSLAVAAVELGGIRSMLMVPLIAEGTTLGLFTIYRQEVRPFSDKQVTLLENFAAQAVIAIENARLLDELRAARDAAEEASRTIETAYRDLKAAQANLIQAEKMASLGQLTAGIAHEIKNPLNFVNNFASLSVELLDELKATAAPALSTLEQDQRANIEDIGATLTTNLEKIVEHGQRADGIVRGMLEHSRGTSGERRTVDLNVLIDEALSLAYHGARAQDQSFDITLERDFGEGIAPIEVNPQDIIRVFLNIFGNGFYAVTRRARNGGDVAFVPALKVTTCDAGEAVETRVRDNGTGIPVDIRDKLFQPFFTTKPTGEGTGLGLSITYDIVTQQHGGSIAVDSEVGEYSEFTIRLPRNP